MAYAAMNSFNAGELSSKMIGRIDVSQYGKGCLRLKNFFVTPYGSAERRPGTLFIAAAKNTDTDIRLIPFIYSADIYYLCEFGDNYIRIYRDDAFVCEIVSPYGVDDLADLKYVQAADVMFIVHESYPVHEFKRTGETTFTIAEMPIAYPAVLDPNTTNTTITPSALEGNITLTASASLFQAGHVGSYWELVHLRNGGEINTTYTTAGGTTSSIEVRGYWYFSTHGTWNATIKIQRSTDGGSTWLDFRTYRGDSDTNIEASGEETDSGVLYRVSLQSYTQAADTYANRYCKVVLNNAANMIPGVVKITGFTSATSVSGTVIVKLGATSATKEWSEGAWSAVRGYPRTIAFYEERLMFGGTANQPNTLWGSKVNNWNNFELGDKDDDGLAFTLASDTVNAIHWMVQHDALVIGTVDAEWTLSSSSSGTALTPTNVYLRRQSVYGSKPINAKMVGDVLAFVQRKGRKLRAFVYSLEKQGYTSPDLTVMAEHVTESGVVDIQLQQQPDTILWCLLANGQIAALTYERDQAVVGWQKHYTDGQILSVAIIPNNYEDLIYLAVQRTGGVYIERLAPRSWDAIADAVYTDSSKAVTGSGITVVSGLGHLEGKTVQVLADGAKQNKKTVTDGAITLDSPADKVCVGLGYESLLTPMPIEVETQNGLSILRRKTVSELRIRVYASIGGEARAGEGDFQEIISRDVLSDSLSVAIEPKTETVQIQAAGGYSDTTIIDIRQCDPLPLNIALVTAIYGVVE